MKKILLGILPLFFLFGCSSYVSRYFFNYEQTDNSVKQLVQKNELYAGYHQFYEDDIIKLRLDCEPIGIRFYLINKTNEPLIIIWDSARVSSEYLHKLILINHSNKTQDNIVTSDSSDLDFGDQNILNKMRKGERHYVIKPSIILAKQTWMDEIQFNKNEYLLPYQLSNKDSLINESKSVIGEKITLLLPIKVNEKIIDYAFVFTIKDFEILSKQ